MNVSLTAELERIIQKKVESGMYSSASEVIRDALRLMAERDVVRDKKIRALRRELDIGRRELDRGEGKPFDAQRVRRLIAAHTSGRQNQRRKSA